MKYKIILLITLFVPCLSFDYEAWVLKLARRYRNKKLIGNYTIDINGLEMMRDILGFDFQEQGLAVLYYKMLPENLELYIYFSRNQIISTSFSFITQPTSYKNLQNYFEKTNFTNEKMNEKANAVSANFTYEPDFLAFFQHLNFLSSNEIRHFTLKNITLLTTKNDNTSFQILLHIWYKRKKFKIQISASIKNNLLPFHGFLYITLLIVKVFYRGCFPDIIKSTGKNTIVIFLWFSFLWNILEFVINYQSTNPFVDGGYSDFAFFISDIFLILIELLIVIGFFYLSLAKVGFTKYFLCILIPISPLYLLYHYPSFCDYIFYLLFFSTFIPEILVIHLYKIKKITGEFLLFIPFFINRVYFPLIYILCGQHFPTIHISWKVFLIGLTVNIIQLIILYYQQKYGYDFYKVIFKKSFIYTFLVPYEDILRDKTKYKDIHSQLCSICLNQIINLEDFENLMTNERTTRNHKEESSHLNSTISTINASEKNLAMNKLIIQLENPTFLKKFKKINKNKGIVVTPCNHFFHLNCIKVWWKLYYYCPICQRDLTPV